MKADLIRRLCCPLRECGGGLTLHTRCTSTINYRNGPVEEVREGSLDCSSCGRSYPIEEYVPSFEQIYPADLQDESDYWSKWYSFMWEQGYLGFFDLKAPRAPLITEGITVLDPSSLDRNDSAGTHVWLADHPLIKDAGRILDMGCGSGWSSPYLARRGHEVVGFDPSASNMRLAKRYAISEGEYIEYLGAAIGYLTFQPEQFDAIFALHSLHHVPRLGAEMPIIRSWMRDGGGIAIDEHIYTHPILDAMANELRSWAETEIYPESRTLDLSELEALPRTPSALEDAGSEEVVGAFLDHFALQSYTARCVSLDYFSFIYYLSRDLSKLLFADKGSLNPDEVNFLSAPIPDISGYRYAADVLNLFYRLLLRAFPEAAEYVTMVGRKGHDGDNSSSASDLLPHIQKLSGRNVSGLERAANADTEQQHDEAPLSLSSQQEVGVSDNNETLVQPIMEPQTIAIATPPTESMPDDVDSLSHSIYRKNAYIDKLEHTLLVKNEHIRRLERLLNTRKGEVRKPLLARLRRMRNTFARRSDRGAFWKEKPHGR